MQNKNLPHDNKDLIAYAAGLFDGEFNINYAKYNCNSPNGKVYKNGMSLLGNRNGRFRLY